MTQMASEDGAGKESPFRLSLASVPRLKIQEGASVVRRENGERWTLIHVWPSGDSYVTRLNFGTRVVPTSDLDFDLSLPDFGERDAAMDVAIALVASITEKPPRGGVWYRWERVRSRTNPRRRFIVESSVGGAGMTRAIGFSKTSNGPMVTQTAWR